MAKRKKIDKCKDCGHRLVLAGTTVDYVEPDQEPYEDGFVEPVIVDKQEITEICIDAYVNCSVCPKCGWVSYIEFEGG